MDSRLDVFRILGLRSNEAHIIRNAGGILTEDALRSLIISQRLLGTTDIVLIHHTDCGMLTFTDAEFRARIASEVGIEPPFSFHPFSDLETSVRESMERIRTTPFLVHRNVRGYIFDVATGELSEVV
jgi:carbonic anhydrase